MKEQSYVRELAREFPPVSLQYVQANHPGAMRAAMQYKKARNAISLDDHTTVTTARKALNKLMERVTDG